MDFHEPGAVAGPLHGDSSLGRDSRRLLARLGKSGLAHEFRRGVQVALGLDQRLLALHHARAGALAELLDFICGDIHWKMLPYAPRLGALRPTGRRRGALAGRVSAGGVSAVSTSS